MTDLNSLITGIIQFFSKRMTALSIMLVEERLLQMRDYSDDRIRSELQNYFNGSVSIPVSEKKSIKDRLVSRVNRVIFKNDLDPTTTDIIALGAEAFRRAPADLPAGSVLFKQQLQAAVAITQQCLVQMNTGEGKTYAILPGALALLARHAKVYIICANNYLAERDAKRTKRYWDFLGISVGLGLPGVIDPSNWKAQIIYTTLEAIIFHHLNTQLLVTIPENAIDFSCCIIDEADSVLLDQSGQNYSVVEEFSTRRFDWQFAFRTLESIDPEKDIDIDPFDHSCALTESGEHKIKEAIYAENIGIDQLGTISKSVEIAFAAQNVVKENVDYIIEDDRIHPFNRVSGKVAYNQYRDWIIPLELLMGLSPRPERQDIVRAESSLFIKKFKHKSGLSGTLDKDIIEYVTLFLLPIIIIKPRLPRHKVKVIDLLYPVKEGAIDSICKEILKSAIDQQRPVLVGCENIYEVQEICKRIISRPGIESYGLKVFAITGKDDVNIAEIFENGGEVGSIIVATRLGGRGVDIRLSDAAIRNGGLALFSLGHSRERRHDEQLLGRAGRQGQPFTAAFYLSLEDELLADFDNTKFVQSMARSFGTKPDENITSPLLSSTVRGAQKQIRDHNLASKYTANNLEAFRFQVQEEQARITHLLQSPANAEKDKGFLSYSFINEIIESFIDIHVRPLLGKNNNAAVCQKLISEIAQFSGLQLPDQFIHEIEDRESGLIIRRIHVELMRITDAIISNALGKSTAYDSVAGEISSVKQEAYGIIKKLNEAITDGEQKLGKLNELQELEDMSGKTAPDSPFELPLPAGEKELIKDYANKLILLMTEESNPAHLKVLIDALRRLKRVTENEKMDSIINTLDKNEINEGHLLSSKRTPRLAAKLSILKCLREYREGCNRNESIMYRKQIKAIDRNRNVLDGEKELWEKYKGAVCGEVLKNIAYLETPEKLKALFWTLENEVEETPQLRKLPEIQWEVTANPGMIARSEAKDEYVDEFIRDNTDQLSKPGEVNKVRFVLTSFLKQNPLSDLRTSSQILTALDKWKKTEVEEFGTAMERRRFNSKWIKFFMLFLRQKGIVGSIPGVRQRVKAYMNSVFGNFSNIKFTLSFVQIILSVLLFAFIASLKNPHNNIKISEFGMYCDRLFLCGCLQKGLMNGPVMCGFLITALIIKNKTAPIVKILSVFLTVLFSVIIFWNGSSTGTIATSLLIILFTALLSRLFYNTIIASEMAFGLNLLSVWLFVSLANYVYSSFHLISMESALMASLGIAYFLFSTRINKVELVFMSTWFKSSVISMDTENIRIGNNIEGISIPAYFHALIGTLIANFSLGHSGFIVQLDAKYGVNALYLLDTLIFLAILIYSNQKAIRGKTKETIWRKKLSDSRQILVDGNVLEQTVEMPLGESLKKARKKLFAQSVLFHVVTLGVAAALLYRQSRTEELMPVALIIYTVSILLIYYAVNFLSELRGLFMGTVSGDFDSVDISDLNEKTESEEGGFWHKFMELFEPKWKFVKIMHVITVLAILYEVIHTIIKNFMGE